MYIIFLNKSPKIHCNHTVTSGEKSLPHSTGALCKGFGFFPEGVKPSWKIPSKPKSFSKI